MEFFIQLATIITPILSLIGIGMIIWKGGQHNQKVSSDIMLIRDNIQELKVGKSENKNNIEKTLILLREHIADNTRHIDIRMETLLDDARKEQLGRIERQLEQLLSK